MPIFSTMRQGPFMQSDRLQGTPGINNGVDDDEPVEVEDTDREYDESVDDEITEGKRHV